jgi:hypothetical protein
MDIKEYIDYRTRHCFNGHGKFALVLLLTLAYIAHGHTQVDTLNPDLEKEEHVILGSKPLDTTYIETKNKIFTLIELEEGIIVDRLDLRTGEKKRILDVNGEKSVCTEDSNKFKGHWSGFEYGLTNFINNDYAFSIPAGYEFMDIRTFNSWNLNLNFMQTSIPIVGNRAGLVWGLGSEWNFYRFQESNSIKENELTGNIDEWVLEDDYQVLKSKLRTWYLTMPLLLEVQFGRSISKERFYIAGGPVGGLRLSNVSKIVHDVEGDKQKIKIRGNDLNIRKWRLGLTARVGYADNMNIYATYYLTPFFEDEVEPEIYPVSIGFRINF